MKDNLFESILAESSEDDLRKQKAADRLFASPEQAGRASARKTLFAFKGHTYGIARRIVVTGWQAEVNSLDEYELYENSVKTDFRFKTPSEAIDYILQKRRVYMPDVEDVNTLDEVHQFEVDTSEIISLMKNVIKSFELAKEVNFDKALNDRAKAFNDLA